jgi:hypothetical protein
MVKTYEEMINEFIPTAVIFADRAIKQSKYKNRESFCFAWNKVYYAKMNELTIATGLRVAVDGASRLRILSY